MKRKTRLFARAILLCVILCPFALTDMSLLASDYQPAVNGVWPMYGNTVSQTRNKQKNCHVA